jgi:hypothetical protein
MVTNDIIPVIIFNKSKERARCWRARLGRRRSIGVA